MPNMGGIGCPHKPATTMMPNTTAKTPPNTPAPTAILTAAGASVGPLRLRRIGTGNASPTPASIAPAMAGMTKSTDRPVAKNKRMETNNNPNDTTATAAVSLRSANRCQTVLPAEAPRRAATGLRGAAPIGKNKPTSNGSPWSGRAMVGPLARR